MRKKTKFQIRSEAAKKRWHRDEDKEAFWRIQIRQWQLSRLSVRKYCQDNDMSESSFRAWRREISLRDREFERPMKTSSPASVPQVASFVPVRLVPDMPEPTERREPKELISDSIKPIPVSTLEITLPGAATIKIDEKTNLTLVARLLTALQVNQYA